MASRETVIRIDDVRLAGHCGKGFRGWFRQHFGRDDTDAEFAARVGRFLDHGMPVEDWLEGGDYLAKRVVERKLERERE